MFLQLQSNKMLNMKYLQDVFQGFHDKNIVIFYLTNGNKFIETYENETKSEERIKEIRKLMLRSNGLSQSSSFSDLPSTGNEGEIYIAKDSGQTYYWDEQTQSYIKTGTAGRTGIYSYNKNLDVTPGKDQTLRTSDLIEILKPTVEYMEGSEVIGKNNTHGIIIKTNKDSVVIRTTVDLMIESFKQVSKETDLPKEGSNETLYFVEETDKLYSYDKTEKKYIVYYSSEQVDSAIKATKDELNKSIKTVSNNLESAKTDLNKSIKTVSDNLTSAKTELNKSITDLSNDLTSEISARKSADSGLNKSIGDLKTHVDKLDTSIGNISTLLDTLNGEVV